MLIAVFFLSSICQINHFKVYFGSLVLFVVNIQICVVKYMLFVRISMSSTADLGDALPYDSGL